MGLPDFGPGPVGVKLVSPQIVLSMHGSRHASVLAAVSRKRRASMNLLFSDPALDWKL